MDLYFSLPLVNVWPAQGDVTVGWNCSTTPSSSDVQPANKLEPSQYTLVKYVSPMQHAAAVSDTIRAAKQQTALQMREWTCKYGKEGAAGMQQMQKLLPVKPTTRYKVCCHFHTSPWHASVSFAEPLALLNHWLGLHMAC